MKKFLFFLTFILITSISVAQSTYNDVAKIFFKRCTSCHHDEGGAPFSLINFTETASFATSIKSNVQIGKMPPLFTDTTYTRFLKERLLTASEKAAIIKWVDDGALEGDPALAPVAPVYTKYQIAAKPDIIVKVPPFASNADAADMYNCFALKIPITTNRIIRAFEIVPNNAKIIHHVVVTIDTTGNAKDQVDGQCYTQPGQLGIGGYTPGSGPTIFPNDPRLKMGITIKPGWQIIAQNHYPPGSAKQIDSTEIRLYLYPEGTTGVREVHEATPLQNWLMPMMPGLVSTFTADWAINNSSAYVKTTVKGAISIYGTYPHAHKVNRSMRINAFKKGVKDSIPIIHVPNWDFNWEGVYHHQRLLKIPEGYTIHSKHVYDNTTNNKKNPNSPPKYVGAGPKSSDEMLFDSFEWMDYQVGDENIDLEDILSHDPLLLSVNDKIGTNNIINSYAFPTPAVESTTIMVKNTLAEKCELKLVDINGKIVKVNTTRNADSFLIKRGDLPSGVYFYTLTSSNNYKGSGKIIFMPQAK
ncbi:MAG: T9SS type A sorting domain-containing protein [Bacteroidia bacterium]